jgi:pimeloyl-ACP methyl ester carboxylesterase
MTTYILIHGAWHGAWCWNKVVPLLQQAGHRAIALDLPGHGDDKTPASEISLRSYVDRVCRVLDERPEPVVLVGHSLGGMTITQTAEDRPLKIKMLVYLAAFVPRNGQSCRELLQTTPDAAPLLARTAVPSADGSYSALKLDAVKELFYDDCTEEDVVFARSSLCPNPAAPVAEPVTITAENYGRLPKTYIETLRDKALLPFFQEKMYGAVPFDTVIKMNTSHSPFFSQPGQLAAHLIAL